MLFKDATDSGVAGKDHAGVPAAHAEVDGEDHKVALRGLLLVVYVHAETLLMTKIVIIIFKCPISAAFFKIDLKGL